jgi:hypothetical protein
MFEKKRLKRLFQTYNGPYSQLRRHKPWEAFKKSLKTKRAVYVPKIVKKPFDPHLWLNRPHDSVEMFLFPLLQL